MGGTQLHQKVGGCSPYEITTIFSEIKVKAVEEIVGDFMKTKQVRISEAEVRGEMCEN